MVSLPTSSSLDWYSNAGGVAKEIDHVIVDGRWRMIQNCRVYWSAQFLNTDHWLAATLKLQLKSRPGQLRSGSVRSISRSWSGLASLQT